MGMKSAGLVAAIAILSGTALSAQVLRPTVPVIVPKPTVKLPGATPSPTPAPATTQAPAVRSTVPGHFMAPTMEFIGTVPGTPPSKSPDVTASDFAGRTFDYTITVPLHVANMPAIYTGASVRCAVALPQDAANPQADFPDRLASNFWGTPVPLTGGGFAGNVIIGLNVLPGYDAGAARIYECAVDFTGVDRGTAFTAHPEANPVTHVISYVPPIAAASPPKTSERGLIP